MKTFKNILLFAVIYLGCAGIGMAQSHESAESKIHIPEGYYQEQGQTTESAGVASYNIDENTGSENSDGAASWRQNTYSTDEVIHIYSGKQDGNNVIRKVEVNVPAEAWD